MHQNRKLKKLGDIAHFALAPVDLPQTLCMCPCVHVCVCVRVGVSVCMCMCVRIIVHACTCIYVHTNAHTHISSHPRTQTCLTCLSRIPSLLPKKEIEIPQNTKTNTPRYNVCNLPSHSHRETVPISSHALSHSLSFNLLYITIRATP